MPYPMPRAARLRVLHHHARLGRRLRLHHEAGLDHADLAVDHLHARRQAARAAGGGAAGARAARRRQRERRLAALQHLLLVRLRARNRIIWVG